ncbi:NAD(P)/FAD-dependent oxidoreductase [Luteolibacter sp. AS25]|uniref:NAD(P)/FAD-dependent oxidoreductase n=1 Tax=Luteolibacter sp. AS25 TaxID=3135776 RepID=UPI00398A7078
MKMMNHREVRQIAEGVDRSADYDVVVIGGAFSGASSALLLKRQFGDLRVLIIEKSESFSRKVGESTSEVAGCFLTRVLRMGMHLNIKHVAKHGLRMWFHKDGMNAPGRSTELGPAYQGRLPTFQLNRMELDAKLLEDAISLGCELVRPATIKSLKLGGIGKNTVSYKTGDGESRTVSAGWVVDASGKAAKIAKQRKTWQSIAEEHPTAAMWTRFKNVNYLDSEKGVEMMEGVSARVVAQRGSATNHLMGFGWWCWIIPLGSGEVSAGLTWDSRLFTPPSDGTMAERLKEHMLKHPVGKVMFEDAVAVENDNSYYKGLAYYSEEVAGAGWTTVGDACGFMDPLYSQGLDYCAHTIYSSYTLLRSYYSGECVKDGITWRNKEFVRSYFDWFNALYKDKYYYLGDAELMHAAFLLDVGTYFVGPVRGVYTDEDAEFSQMPYAGAIGGGFAKFMAFYNRRFVEIAKKKITAGKYGEKNLDESFLITGSFSPDPSSFKLIFKGLKIWAKLEAKYAFTPTSADIKEPSMSTPLPQAGHYEHA